MRYNAQPDDLVNCGGPYGPGSTDVGAAIMYVFIFFASIIVERSSNYNKYSLDVLIERKLNGWKHLAEFYEDKSSSTKLDEFQTARKTILPEVDPLFVQNVILSQQQQNPQEQLPTTFEMFSDTRKNPEAVGKVMHSEKNVTSSKEN